jgi:V/A-type H+/Na+-transporting ATPase subunit E
MSQKLQELTQKLYQEGVERARIEAEKILEETEQSKQEILVQAKKEAEVLIENGKREAEKLVAKGESELKLAAQQSISALRQKTVELLAHAILGDGIDSALDDRDFLKSLIHTLVSKWSSESQSLDLKLILSKEKQNGLEEFLKKELVEHLNRGLLIEFDERMKTGFRVVAKDGSFMLSFSDQDFEAFFQSFVKDNIRSVLFTEN